MDKLKLKTTDNKYKSSTKLFQTARDMYQNKEKNLKSIAVCLLKAIVYKHSTNVNMIKEESKFTNFY